MEYEEEEAFYKEILGFGRLLFIHYSKEEHSFSASRIKNW
jgi:hypothetical protein